MSNRGTKTKKRSNSKRVRKPLSVGTATTIIGLSISLIGLIGLIALRTPAGREMKKPPAEVRLLDATQLALYRGVKVTRNDKTEDIGDWLVALETGHRIVLFRFEREGKRI